MVADGSPTSQAVAGAKPAPPPLDLPPAYRVGRPGTLPEAVSSAKHGLVVRRACQIRGKSCRTLGACVT
jgi:hypothetical protein